MPISVSQQATQPHNWGEGTRKQLSTAKRALDAYQRNIKAIQLLGRVARQARAINHLVGIQNLMQYMGAFSELEKVLRRNLVFGLQINDFLTSPLYQNATTVFNSYETFWANFSQPPLIYIPPTISSGEVKRKNSWLPQFYPQEVGSKKANLNKTIPKTFSTHEKSWKKTCRYFVPKESREKLEQFWRDLQEDNQTMERDGNSKPIIFISFYFKIFTKICYVPLGGGMIYLFKKFFN